MNRRSFAKLLGLAPVAAVLPAAAAVATPVVAASEDVMATELYGLHPSKYPLWMGGSPGPHKRLTLESILEAQQKARQHDAP